MVTCLAPSRPLKGLLYAAQRAAQGASALLDYSVGSLACSPTATATAPGCGKQAHHVTVQVGGTEQAWLKSCNPIMLSVASQGREIGPDLRAWLTDSLHATFF